MWLEAWAESVPRYSLRGHAAHVHHRTDGCLLRTRTPAQAVINEKWWPLLRLPPKTPLT